MTAGLAWATVALFYALLAASLYRYWRGPLLWAIAGLLAAVTFVCGGAVGFVLFVAMAYI